MKYTILIPTYNESKNIEEIISTVIDFAPEVYIKVIDDNSPDGTGKIVEKLKQKYPNLSILSRVKKDGLGNAYIAGFKEVLLDGSSTHIITMDADLSHNPKYLKEIIKESSDYDLVIGSRYISGGKTRGWEFWRRALSFFGNLYARLITWIPINDLTGGFNCISVEYLRKIDLNKISSSGYAFQMEIKSLLYFAGAKIKEVPIIFDNRAEGESKISNHIISEGLLAPWKIIFNKPNKTKRSFLTKHYRVLLLAIFIGLVSSLPQYFYQNSLPRFQGIYFGVADDMAFYQARSKEVLDGHLFIGNPYFAEDKSGPPMQFWIPDAILATPIGWLGLSVPLGFIIWTFILTSTLLLLSYFILLILTKSENWSLAFSVMLNLGFFGSQFLRLAPPGLTFVFWLSALLAILCFLEKGGLWRAFIASFFFGLLFNIYPFYWTYYVIFYGLFIFFSFILKKYNFQYKNYIGICVFGLIFAIPFFLATFQSIQMPWYAESARRLGMISTHFPSGLFNVFIAGLVLLIFVAAYIKKIINISPVPVLLFSGVLASIIAVNQHIITGKNVEFSSHYLLGTLFICFFSASYIYSLWYIKQTIVWQKIISIFVWILVIITSVNGLITVVSAQTISGDLVLYSQNYKPIFDWLNKNTLPDQVVFADDNLSLFIPIYTSENVFYSPYGILFFLTDRESLDRFIGNHYFDVFDRDYVIKNQRMIFGGYYINQYGHNLSKNNLKEIFGLAKNNYTLLPDNAISTVLDRAKILQKEDFLKILHMYKTDYVIWDTNNDPNWHLDRFEFLTKVYSINGFIIYKIK